jgi:hypothetical protein
MMNTHSYFLFTFAFHMRDHECKTWSFSKLLFIPFGLVQIEEYDKIIEVVLIFLEKHVTFHLNLIRKSRTLEAPFTLDQI